MLQNHATRLNIESLQIYVGHETSSETQGRMGTRWMLPTGPKQGPFYIKTKNVPGGRVTRLPELPWGQVNLSYISFKY